MRSYHFPTRYRHCGAAHALGGLATSPLIRRVTSYLLINIVFQSHSAVASLGLSTLRLLLGHNLIYLRYATTSPYGDSGPGDPRQSIAIVYTLDKPVLK
jgi:hypothetical protein